MQSLSPRQQSILNRVVDTHIETAQPVGSKSITALYQELYRSSYSPATVRHEMGVLEEKGYLMHPHTSAGRVPTDLGYRYYVDHGLKEEELADDIQRQIRQMFYAQPENADALTEEACRMLSSLTEEACLIFLSGRNPSGSSPRMFVYGSSRILEKPEFQDRQQVRSIFMALEERKTLVDWLYGAASVSKVFVGIGRENKPEALKDCAVISSQCRAGKQPVATLAVIGPRRIRYAKAVSYASRIADLLGRALEEHFSES